MLNQNKVKSISEKLKSRISSEIRLLMFERSYNEFIKMIITLHPIALAF